MSQLQLANDGTVAPSSVPIFTPFAPKPRNAFAPKPKKRRKTEIASSANLLLPSLLILEPGPLPAPLMLEGKGSEMATLEEQYQNIYLTDAACLPPCDLHVAIPKSFSLGCGLASTGACIVGQFGGVSEDSMSIVVQVALMLGLEASKLKHLYGQSLAAGYNAVFERKLELEDAYERWPAIFEKPNETIPRPHQQTQEVLCWKKCVFGGRDETSDDWKTLGCGRGQVPRYLIWRMMRLAALNACVYAAGGIECVRKCSWRTMRLAVFAAVLSSVDAGGMKVLLYHVWIAAQCHWEYFHKGDWWDICMNVLLDPSKYWLGEKLEKEKNTDDPGCPVDF